MKKTILILMAALSLAFVLPSQKKITIWMCGDSTMSIKETKAYPETGWGMPFSCFWDTSAVAVVNKAKNGRSTRTFISEGIWQSVIDNVQENDYVFIEFGHNDESPEKKDRYTTLEQYKINLQKFINEARDKKAIPVLFTPVSRRKFDSTGMQVPTHEAYSLLVKAVAEKEKVLFIDMDTQTQAFYQQLGKEGSANLFLQLQPGEHPNYPDGKIDNTHFNEYGARLIAQMAFKNIKALNTPLNQHIVTPVTK